MEFSGISLNSLNLMEFSIFTRNDPEDDWNGLCIPTVLDTGRKLLQFPLKSSILAKIHDFNVISLEQ